MPIDLRARIHAASKPKPEAAAEEPPPPPPLAPPAPPAANTQAEAARAALAGLGGASPPPRASAPRAAASAPQPVSAVAAEIIGLAVRREYLAAARVAARHRHEAGWLDVWREVTRALDALDPPPCGGVAALIAFRERAEAAEAAEAAAKSPKSGHLRTRQGK